MLISSTFIRQFNHNAILRVPVQVIIQQKPQLFQIVASLDRMLPSVCMALTSKGVTSFFSVLKYILFVWFQLSELFMWFCQWLLHFVIFHSPRFCAIWNICNYFILSSRSLTNVLNSTELGDDCCETTLKNRYFMIPCGNSHFEICQLNPSNIDFSVLFS